MIKLLKFGEAAFQPEGVFRSSPVMFFDSPEKTDALPRLKAAEMNLKGRGHAFIGWFFRSQEPLQPQPAPHFEGIEEWEEDKAEQVWFVGGLENESLRRLHE